MSNKFYVTTPIYYPSAKLHLGHAYCTVATDTVNRYKKQKGFDTYFLTGTDEHGQKIERTAAEKGLSPLEYVDGIVEGIKELWQVMNIEYDDFIRTSQPRHIKGVQKVFKQLYDQGDIYKGEYEGWYCTPCEAFFTELQLLDGNCPDCGRPVEKTKEENYFLKLSKYQDWLMQYIEDNPDFIQPASRKNEMINNFLKPGLEDLCVSRTTIKWGIPVSFDNKHTVYVWIDALTNYITALGYGSDNLDLYNKYWPADLHLVGKEIIRFHTIIWPIVLHALNLPLPKQVFGHGWLVMGGNKMSKSMGNTIDPVALCNKYSADAIRYYLMKAIPFGSDSQYVYASMLTLINSDLTNNLGNLVSRTVAMVEKYFKGVIQAPNNYEDIDKELIEKAEVLPQKVENNMDKLMFHLALDDIWNLIGDCNKYIDVTEPWILGRTEEGHQRLSTVLYVLLECIRYVAVLIKPVMPNTPEKIFAQIGISDAVEKSWDSLGKFGNIKAGSKVKKLDNLFPRIDIKKEIEEENKQQEQAEQEEEKAPELKENIDIEQFDKTELRVAKVIDCTKLEKSDKLLKLTVDLGFEKRTIVSGIAQFYKPEDIVGKQVVIVANLKPIKLRGVESQGMVLTASYIDKQSKKEKLSLLTVSDLVLNGAEVR